MSLLLRYWPHLLALIVLVCVIGVGARWCYVAGADSVQAEYQSHLAADAQAQAQAQELAREVERKRASRMAEIAAQTKRRIEHAQKKADQLVSDLRAGNVRLRQHWRGCVATDRVSATAAAAARADAAAELRRASAAAIIAAADEADAQVRGLQEVIRESHKAQ